MNLNFKKLFIFSIAFFLIFFAQNAHAITLSPVRIEVSGDPGGVIQTKVKILNESEQLVTLYKSAEGFEGEGETGTPKLNGSVEGLPSWINTENQIDIDPGKVEEIPVAIVVPKDTPGGGYYGALCWSENPNISGGVSSVVIGSKICSIVLVNVSGDVKEGGGVLEYFLSQNKKYYNSLPVSFTYRFQNTGNGLVKPEGEILIKNFGLIKAKSLNANPTEGNVLPRGGIRRFEISWFKNSRNPEELEEVEGFFKKASYQWRNFAFGRFTAELNLNFGSKEFTNEIKKIYFWVIPWQLILIILVVFIIFYFLLKKTIRSYNRWVIMQAEIAIKKEMNTKFKARKKEESI